jgi:YVTN family beta-propeller protein
MLTSRRLRRTLLCLTSCWPLLASAAAPQRLEREGVTIELNLAPVAGPDVLREGQDADLRLTLEDAAGTPVTGLRPALWIDARTDSKAGGAPACGDKVRAFLQGSLAARPSVDVNSFYIVTLNREPNLSVIDPLVEFGGSRLLALAKLDAPGEDWALSVDTRHIYVSLPSLNRVAAVDTSSWSTTARFDVGPRPTQLLLQSDGRSLWVAQDPDGPAAGQGGVTLIDVAAGRPVQTVVTGAGPHTLALGRDERMLYVVSRGARKLHVIDTDTRAVLRQLDLGPAPVSVAYSPLSAAAYVADEEDGTLRVIDGETHAPRAQITSSPGLSLVRFAPGGRWGFLVNPRAKSVAVLDSSADRVVHRLELPGGPDDVAFSRSSAYFHQRGSENVGLVSLQALEASATPGVFVFPGGETAPERAGERARASAVAPTPEGDAVLVSNPLDEVIYYYKEGMAVPMGHYQNYRRRPRAVMVVDRSLREIERGLYAARVTLPPAGRYDVALLLDAPRVVHCFDLQVEPPQDAPAARPRARLELLAEASELVTGRPARVRLRLIDPVSGAPRVGLDDVRLLALQPPGVWQQRAPARPVAGQDGVYEAEVTFQEPALHYFFVSVPSLGLGFNEVPFATGTVASPAEAGKESR